MRGLASPDGAKENAADSTGRQRLYQYLLPRPFCPAPTPAAFSTDTFRKNSAAASGRTVLINIPDPNSNPATRVSRGITLTYQ